MKLKRITACILSAVLMLPAFSYAAEEKLAKIDEAGVITINGTTEERSGTKVTFMIVRPKYTEESLKTEEGKNKAVEEIYQGTVTEDHTFTYSYTLDSEAKSGIYVINVMIDGEKEKRTGMVTFKNTQRLKAAVAAINDGANVADIIDTYKDDIDYNTSIKYDQATPEQKAYITGAIKAPVTETGEGSLTEFFKEYTDIAFMLLSNPSITTNGIKKAVEELYLKIGITEDEYTSYTELSSDSKRETAIAYMYDNYDSSTIKTMSDFISLYKDGIKEAKKSKNESVKDSYVTPKDKDTSDGTIVPPGMGDMYLFDPAASESFDDIGQALWAKDAIEKLSEHKIITGKSKRIFAPNDNITREEFASLIVRAFQLSQANREIAFTDVDKNAWYYETVKTAYNCGVITGKTSETFGVGELITRQDMAIMLQRAVDYSGMEIYPIYLDKTVTDLDQVAEYASEAVELLVSAGKINGYEDGSFRPYVNATRAQAAQMIYNMLFV